MTGVGDDTLSVACRVGWLETLKPGDFVQRRISADGVPMELRVTAIEGDVIRCGEWEFHRRTGGEIDSVLGWTGEPGTATGSWLVPIPS